MKVTPLRRHTGLTRRAGLASVTPLRRAPMPDRTAPVRRRRMPSPVTPAVRALLWERAGGRCEIGGETVPRTGWDAHHRQPRTAGDHTASNLLLLCRLHHAAVHAAPGRSRLHGWIVPTWARPADVRVTLHGRRRARLDGCGGYDGMITDGGEAA